MKKTVKDFDVKGKKVLVRCDFNVPMDKEGNITDDRRIQAALPTITYLLEEGAAVILMSHLGRPKGEANPKYSLAPIAQRISDLLDMEILFAEDDEVVGEVTKEQAKELSPGKILLLQNVRYRKEEEKNENGFSEELASLGDLFINDAFGTAHRAHSSTAGIANFLPSGMGFLIEKEINYMGKALENPERPFVAILGGSKVSDKIGVIENLLEKVDVLLIGGGMAYTFLKAQGYEIGKSLLEEDKMDLALEMIKQAKEKNVDLLLPVDSVVASDFAADAAHKTVINEDMPSDWMGLDIGSQTVELYAQKIKEAKTVIWNGPMGVFEMPNFAKGTKDVAKAMAESEAITIIGGGDSAAAVEQLGYADNMSHISTGGGASLEFLEGIVLPGIEVLTDK
ncbi:phosphoglycerate kinase [Alkaliphilus hydrothermalis]|uniref:Phosphoglycerate kinase n=1 Tax=Alkaliphilus hydrothermalis TaxID=1482730 RepID=A0ABS2NNC5_9FIRM|nr:phosphoglycerate kinase [Alkaliphilus hydrothermalis]MBM7614361.1 phosphoglycerate kinase [Alkaliphilus hydrothermalis]